MQQPFCSLTQRFAQIFLVQRLDVRILMRLAQRLLCIFPIQCIGTCIQHFRVAMMQRLSATTDTATRTCHNLNHMILIPPMANIFQQLTRITQTMSNTHLQFKTIQINRRAHRPDHAPVRSSHSPMSARYISHKPNAMPLPSHHRSFRR